MAITRINFIGCGKLGKTIAKLLVSNNLASVTGVLNSSLESAEEAVRFIGQGLACKTAQQLPPADIYFITTRDDAIEKVCNQLGSEHVYAKGSIIVHCSGSLSSDVLSQAKIYGCYIASIHPVKSFANPDESIKNFSGTYCGIEGDENALPILNTLFTRIGGIVFGLSKEHKKLYHAAGVMASNYLVTLHHQAFECYKAAGVDDSVATKIVSLLMNDTLNNINKLDHKKALTGPIQRGDTFTVEGHLNQLNDYPLTRAIYSTLGQATLFLTSHSEQQKEEIKIILSGKDEKNK